MSHEDLNRAGNPAELAAVETTLRALVPIPARLDRDQLMFSAGAASVETQVAQGEQAVGLPQRPRSYFWQMAAGLLGATSLALAAALLVRPQPAERIVYRTLPASPSAGGQDAPNQIQPPSVVAAPRTGQPAVAAAPPTESLRDPLSPDNYLRRREIALRMGLDAIGSPRSGGGGDNAPTYFDWLTGLSAAKPGEGSPAIAPPSM
jgi:hypothetical protein